MLQGFGFRAEGSGGGADRALLMISYVLSLSGFRADDLGCRVECPSPTHFWWVPQRTTLSKFDLGSVASILRGWD